MVSRAHNRDSGYVDAGSTVTVLTLSMAILLVMVVAFGVVTVEPADAQSAATDPGMTQSSGAETPAPTGGAQWVVASAAPVEVQSSPDTEPTSRSDGAADSPDAASGAVTPAVARSQPSASSSPLAAQPAPFESPSASPSASASPSCPAAISGQTAGAPGATSPLGVAGTTSDDLQAFAEQYNAIRVEQCLPPVPFANIRYDRCMEDRLFWMAEDPSTDPMSAWGHIGSQRSDGVPSVGCDGNLAGGSGNTGASVAQKWWDSSSHRASLYKPTYVSSTSTVCILFAAVHGGIPNEPYTFVRAAARWTTC
jgi:uncharacterized protein YkwD